MVATVGAVLILGLYRMAKNKARQLLHLEEVVAVLNGDWGDINTHAGAQLIEHENRNTVLNFMIQATRPMCAVTKKCYVVRGTEAHTGGAGWLEEHAANEIKSQPDPHTGLSSFWVLRLQVEGVRFLIAHHPMTNSRVRWTIGSAANRAAASVALDYCKDPNFPDLAIFGHVHHSEDSFDNQPVRAIYTPPWCLVGSFGHRLGVGLAPSEQIGGLIIVVDGKGYRVFKRYTKTPIGDRQWIKI